MKSSLAFAGALVLVFATGAMLTRIVSTDRGFTAFNPINKSPLRPTALPLHPELAPDSSSVGAALGLFVPNLGQASHDVYFQWIGASVTAHFQASAISLQSRAGRRDGVEQQTVRVRFVGAGRRPHVEASKQSPERLTYPVGGQNFYRASIPVFNELAYTGLYDGVELHFVALESGLVRRFTFAPGAVPSALLMHFEGGGQPSLSAAHQLEFRASPVKLAYPRPAAYQVIDGVRTAVSADFEIRRFGSVGITVPEYDPSLPLVVEISGV